MQGVHIGRAFPPLLSRPGERPGPPFASDCSAAARFAVQSLVPDPFYRKRAPASRASSLPLACPERGQPELPSASYLPEPAQSPVLDLLPERGECAGRASLLLPLCPGKRPELPAASARSGPLCPPAPGPFRRPGARAGRVSLPPLAGQEQGRSWPVSAWSRQFRARCLLEPAS